jgi:hypothetical protein
MKPRDNEGGPEEATLNISMISFPGKLVPYSSLLHIDLYVKCLLPERELWNSNLCSDCQSFLFSSAASPLNSFYIDNTYISVLYTAGAFSINSRWYSCWKWRPCDPIFIDATDNLEVESLILLEICRSLQFLGSNENHQRANTHGRTLVSI